jgi:hypothetical protein
MSSVALRVPIGVRVEGTSSFICAFTVSKHGSPHRVTRLDTRPWHTIARAPMRD